MCSKLLLSSTNSTNAYSESLCDVIPILKPALFLDKVLFLFIIPVSRHFVRLSVISTIRFCCQNSSIALVALSVRNFWEKAEVAEVYSILISPQVKVKGGTSTFCTLYMAFLGLQLIANQSLYGF